VEVALPDGKKVHDVFQMSGKVFLLVSSDYTFIYEPGDYGAGAIVSWDDSYGMRSDVTDGSDYHCVDFGVEASYSGGTWNIGNYTVDKSYPLRNETCLAIVKGGTDLTDIDTNIPTGPEVLTTETGTAWYTLGLVDIDANGDFQLVNYSYTSGGQTFTVDYFDDDLPYENYIDLLSQSSSDGRGFSVGRRHRILSVGVDVVGTRALRVEGKQMMNNIPTAGNDPAAVTEFMKKRLLGRGTDRTIRVEGTSPYPMKVRSVIQEVSV
jgi:hypothetical protein